MNSPNLKFQVILGVLVALVLFSSFAIIAPEKSALIVGIPSGCKSKISLEAPQTVEVTAGATKEVPVKVKSLLCGISYVRLKIYGMPTDIYSVGPTGYPVLAPGKEGNFTVVFDIPEGAEEKTYSGYYVIYANEGTYNLGEVNVFVVSLEKPKAEIKPVVTETKEVIVKTTSPKSSKAIWYFVGLFSAVLAIVLISYEYFASAKKHENWEAVKRPEAEIYKALHAEPRQKVDFESALKKGRKKR